MKCEYNFRRRRRKREKHDVSSLLIEFAYCATENEHTVSCVRTKNASRNVCVVVRRSKCVAHANFQ